MTMPHDQPPTISEVKTLTINLPGGKWPMPAWMAQAFIESVLANDRATYARHMMAVHSGELAGKPGRKTGVNDA